MDEPFAIDGATSRLARELKAHPGAASTPKARPASAAARSAALSTPILHYAPELQTRPSTTSPAQLHMAQELLAKNDQLRLEVDRAEELISARDEQMQGLKADLSDYRTMLEEEETQKVAAQQALAAMNDLHKYYNDQVDAMSFEAEELIRTRGEQMQELKAHLSDYRLMLEEEETEKAAAQQALAAMYEQHRYYNDQVEAMSFVAAEASNSNKEAILKLKAKLEASYKLVEKSGAMLLDTRQELAAERGKMRDLNDVIDDLHYKLRKTVKTLEWRDEQYSKLQEEFALESGRRNSIFSTGPAARALGLRSEASSPQQAAAALGSKTATSPFPGKAWGDNMDAASINDFAFHDDDDAEMEDVDEGHVAPSSVMDAEGLVAAARHQVNRASAAREKCLQRVKHSSNAREKSAATADLKEAEVQLRTARSTRNDAEAKLQLIKKRNCAGPQLQALKPTGSLLSPTVVRKKQVTLTGGIMHGKSNPSPGLPPHAFYIIC